MTTITIKDKIDELEREVNAKPNTHKLSMGLDTYMLLKEELGLGEDSTFNKYHGYEIEVDTTDESGPVRYISKAF